VRAQEFTEPRAAGCIIVAADTGRWCLQQRSDTVSDPGVWSTWGGGREPGESVTQCVRRELAEESGYRGAVRLEPVDSNSMYVTFLAHVPHEFEPELNSESQAYQWCHPEDLPRPLHPGLQQTLGMLNENTDPELAYIGNCTEDEVVDDIFGNVSEFARMVELYGDEFAVGDLVVKYNDDQDIHYFYHKNNSVTENFADGRVKGQQSVAAAANNITYKQQKSKNKFSVEMLVDGKTAGMFQYDANTGRTITELDPAYRGQGLGQRLILKGIYTAAMLGMDYVEDTSRTAMFDRALDSLADAGYIVSDEEYWYVTDSGEQFLKQSVTENFADGKNPGRKGLSKRVGIPRKATLGQLEKIAKSSTGERRRMAQWQLNMRRGRNKKK
jgi:8-oxo-dGTP pyrophosphatase MutT (NUDIX family)